MASTFRIKLLPALHGDCIWIEYGEAGATHHVLVDGGPLGAFGELRAHVEALPADARDVELLVVTHIDADHIDGIVKLLRHPELGLKFREVWFNGWPQLESLAGGVFVPRTGNDRGAVSGEELDLTLVRTGHACNARFRGFAAMVADEGELPRMQLEGGLELTLLSPTPTKLADLRAAWMKTLAQLGAEPGDAAFVGEKLDRDVRFRGEGALPALPGGLDEAADTATSLDAAVANGSSIAFVAEYQGKRCAFLGDAHAPVVQQALGRMARERGEEPFRLDAVSLASWLGRQHDDVAVAEAGMSQLPHLDQWQRLQASRRCCNRAYRQAGRTRVPVLQLPVRLQPQMGRRRAAAARQFQIRLSAGGRGRHRARPPCDSMTLHDEHRRRPRAIFAHEPVHRAPRLPQRRIDRPVLEQLPIEEARVDVGVVVAHTPAEADDRRNPCCAASNAKPALPLLQLDR